VNTPRAPDSEAAALVVEDRLWLAVAEPAIAPAVRRAAVTLGTELGLPERSRADLAIVAAEIATNLGRHADDGTVLLRARRGGGQAGVEIVAVDRGPGMVDVEDFLADGRSTAGTLGIGLGAVARLATTLDIYSRPGAGTVLAATVGPAEAFTPDWVSGVSRPIAGEQVCGDGYAARGVAGRRQLLLCDGLGHGAQAATAAQAVLAEFRSAGDLQPAQLLRHVHERTRHTRGAVVAVADLDPAGVLRFAGIGNVAASVIDRGPRRSLTSLPGILGQQCRDVRQFEYPLPPGALVVLHSDGLTDRWELAAFPGLETRTPVVIAATVLREAARRRDDAAILVARA
jgi:anti-sigma regulatory factor (Ser/Thr protein kinase)